MSYINQILGTLIMCSVSFNLGVVYTWPSGIITLMSSNETTLDRLMTETETYWLGSISSLSPMISTPLSGYFMDVIGRKYVAVSLAVLPAICWILIATWSKVEVILFALFIGGMAGAALVVGPIYTGEVCHESIRGTMAAWTMALYAVGMMVSYMFASLDYDVVIYVNLTMSVLGIIGIVIFVRETPVHLLQKGQTEQAVQSLAFYRKVDVRSKEVMMELNAIHKTLYPDTELDTLNLEEMKLNAKGTVKVKISTWQFFKKSSSTRRGLLIAIVTVMSIFQGLPALQVYAQPIFEKSAPKMSAKATSVIMAVITILFGAGAGVFADLLGRRPLMIYGSLLLCVTSALLGTQMQLDWAPQWVTVFLIYVYTIAFTIGSGSVPYILISEIFLPEVSSIMSMIVIMIGWLVTFLVIFIYQPIEDSFGTCWNYYLFALFGLASAVYSVFSLPETKGLTVDAIQLLLVKPERTVGKRSVSDAP